MRGEFVATRGCEIQTMRRRCDALPRARKRQLQYGLSVKNGRVKASRLLTLAHATWWRSARAARALPGHRWYAHSQPARNRTGPANAHVPA